MAMFNKLPGVAVGGDTGQLRKFSTDVKGILTELEQMLGKIDVAITNTTWSGKDADNFAADWDSRKKAAQDMLRESLNTVAEQATKQAEAQDLVSQA